MPGRAAFPPFSRRCIIVGMSEQNETWQVRDNIDPQARNPWFIIFGIAALILAVGTIAPLLFIIFDVGTGTYLTLFSMLACLEIFVRVGISMWAWHDGQRRGGSGLTAVLLLSLAGITGWIIWLSIRPYESASQPSQPEPRRNA